MISLGRFNQPDTIIPGQGVQAYDRYAYVNNSPMNFNDPSGHTSSGDSPCGDSYSDPECQGGDESVDMTIDIESEFNDIFETKGELAAIYWLAEMFGIELPKGNTWGYIPDSPGNVRGVTPYVSGIDPNTKRGTSDSGVYITSTAFTYDDYTVVLSIMVHEARHAYQESQIEKRHGGVVPELAEPQGAVVAAHEWDADLAVINSGIPLSSQAKQLRAEHMAQYSGANFAGSSCAGSGSPTSCLNELYGTSMTPPGQIIP